MHGGYGANYSLYGYMASDYRLAKQHLVYGRAVSNLLESKKCVTNLLGMHGLKSHVVGTPYFERLYRNYKKPNNFFKGWNLKTILRFKNPYQTGRRPTILRFNFKVANLTILRLGF